MAAQAGFIGHNGGAGEIVDLRKIAARDLDPLLKDEIREWRTELDWDFAPSAELVRQYAGTGSLGGAALVLNGAVAGYGYAVLEEPRGIVGDIYVRPDLRVPEYEAELFRSLLAALIVTPRVTRMESQLMLAGAETAALVQRIGAGSVPQVRVFERLLMSRDRAIPSPPLYPDDAPVRAHFRVEGWNDRFMSAASAIIAAAYKGETDSEINAQYRSPGGARRFLSNIVEYPGCGAFHNESSFIAFDGQSGASVGMVLASFVAADVGHISQLCVKPEARGTGLGGKLLRAAVANLYRHGAQRVSLTVTASNSSAISIYQKFGFHTVRRFFAYIWEA